MMAILRFEALSIGKTKVKTPSKADPLGGSIMSAAAKLRVIACGRLSIPAAEVLLVSWKRVASVLRGYVFTKIMFELSLLLHRPW